MVVEHVLDRPHRRAGHALAEQLLPLERGLRPARRAPAAAVSGISARLRIEAQRGSLASSGRPISSHIAAKKWLECTEM